MCVPTPKNYVPLLRHIYTLCARHFLFAIFLKLFFSSSTLCGLLIILATTLDLSKLDKKAIIIRVLLLFWFHQPFFLFQHFTSSLISGLGSLRFWTFGSWWGSSFFALGFGDFLWWFWFCYFLELKKEENIFLAQNFSMEIDFLLLSNSITILVCG